MDHVRPGRINRLAKLIGARRYLEVGVCEGTTFFEVDVAEKVGVDPVFQFDHSARATAKTTFHQVPSDDFFASASDQSFDLIYLDGLHTYEQTLRDFMNSLRLAHDRTVWILDDTVPNDVYAALPDEQECFRRRRAVGNPDWSWMGDVFKVVFFVATIMKDFDYRTFTGHGQTVLWRSRFRQRESVPLSEIAHLSYDGMIDHKDMMQAASDEDIFAAVSAFAYGKKQSLGLHKWLEQIRTLAIRGRAIG